MVEKTPLKDTKDMADRPITDPGVIEQIRANMPLATMNKKGLTNIAQSSIDIRIEAGQSVDINLTKYGIYVVTSIQIDGTSLLLHKGYYIRDFKILLDPASMIGKLFNIEQLVQGGNTIRITNLLPSNYQILNINKV